MRKNCFALVLLVICAFAAAQQVLNNDGVIKLVKAGLSDDLIITTISASPGAYDISADGLVSLKKNGASDKVIAAILRKSSSTAPGAIAGAPDPSQPPVSANNNDAAPPVSQAEEQLEEGSSNGSEPVRRDARIVIAPMGGFETYFAAAVREKKVPVTLTLDKNSADYFVVSTNTEWRGFVFGSGGSANWGPSGGASNYGAAASSTRGLEASIMLISAKTKDVVWAYEVHKSSHGALLFGTFGARGQQSIAEACAKHLKEYIDKGK